MGIRCLFGEYIDGHRIVDGAVQLHPPCIGADRRLMGLDLPDLFQLHYR